MTSYAENIKPILEAVIEINPKRVLDIGAGFGKYGVLIREALMSDRAEKGDLTPTDDIFMECMETARYFYDRKLLHDIYNNCILTDARTFTFLEGDKWDVVLLIDVVEHMSKQDGIALIKKFKDNGSKILVSTPRNVVMYEKDYYGNDCPKHETQWMYEDFAALNLEAKSFSTPQSFIFII